MTYLRNSIAGLLMALFAMLLLRASAPLAEPARVWVGGIELTAGGEIFFDSGEAVYNPETRTLTLFDAAVTGGFHGAAVYAEGDLILSLSGQNTLTGEKDGIVVLGNLTIAGKGTLRAGGSRSGASVRDCLTVFDNVELDLDGASPLRWGDLHVSPLDTVLSLGEKLRVRPPYTAILTDGALDAAGHELRGETWFDDFSYKMDEPVPVPAEPERAGYWFGGWFADRELTQPFDFTPVYDSAVTLYARWIQIVSLRFDSWGGSELPEAQYAWGEVPLPPAEPERAGYRFLAWYGDERLREEYDWGQPLEGDISLYAKWEKLADVTLYGIDAARYQGEIDWPTVKESGVSFVFLRIGYRGYGSEGLLNPDVNFEMNYEGARAAGLDVGVYFFSQATDSAEAYDEARYVLELLDGRELDLPVIMDFELASDASGGLLGRLYEADLTGYENARVCLSFCAAIEDGGYTAGVYAGNSMLSDELGAALEKAGYAVWLAHWTVQTRYNGDYDYWQYSGAGQVTGIGPEVDLDMRYADTPAQVTGLTVRREEEDNVLRWDRVPGVQGYIVCRSAGSGFMEIARLSGAGSLSFTDPGAAPDSRYAVCAVVRVEGGDLRGPLSETVDTEG